jgi:hypothetical protein
MGKSFRCMKTQIFLCTVALNAHVLWAFENAKTLPQGVRNVRVKTVNTSISEKSSSSGELEPLAKPFMKELTFDKIVNGEAGVKKLLLSAFLEGKYELSDSIGRMTADLQGSVGVVAPVISYGMSESLTFAVGVPYYRAKTSAELGFHRNENFDTFVAHLTKANQVEKANELKTKFIDSSHVKYTLNDKLAKHDYEPLENWSASGLGDIILAAKYRVAHAEFFQFAVTGGLVLPTGRVKDPDLLIDIPFGKGSLGIYQLSAFDEYVTPDLFFNQYAKYTYQTTMQKRVRLKTEQESLEVPVGKVTYDQGDEWELGSSVNYEPGFVLLSGVGFVYTGKFKDRFPDAGLSRSTLEKDTDESGQYWEARVGYSSLPAFKRKTFPLPFTLALEAKHFMGGVNSVKRNFYTADMNVFF